MKIHRQLTAAAFLFISMAIMAQVPCSKKEVKEKAVIYHPTLSRVGITYVYN